jgi:hypothetical protein
VDVVFWTRVGTEKPDELNENLKEIEETLDEIGYWTQRAKMDIPEGTVVTDSYYVDRIVRVGLKK